MRILIAGADEVAFRLAEALMADHRTGILCPERERYEARVASLEVDAHYGSVTSVEDLRGAGVKEADLFIAAGTSDEGNLVACVSAKRLGAKRTVCFLFGPALDLRDGRDDGTDDPLGIALDIDLVVRPGSQLTEEILRIVAVPGALDVEAFVGGRVQLLRHGVEAGAPILKGALKDVGVPEGVVFVMARRGDEVFLPKGDTRFQPGDKLTAMGTMAGINRLLFRYLRVDGGVETRHEATVIGGGTVGLGVALGLEEAGWRVKVIESDRVRCEIVSTRLKGLVLHGDGADLDLLESERVGDAPVLVAVTSNDEKNLLVSLLARSLGVRRVVTRADSPSNERLFERVGIDVVRSARGAAVNRVLSGIGVARAELLAELEHGDAEVIELVVPADLPAIPLTRMKAGLFGIIGAILRRARVIIPRGSDSVEGGDRLLVFCMKSEESSVREFFQEGLRSLAESA
ncbi:MAG: Trk system potassium transporter TrkA [Planctomycetota bacterium]